MTKDEHISRIEQLCAEYFCNPAAATGQEVRIAFEEYFSEFPVEDNRADARVAANMVIAVDVINHYLMYMSDQEKRVAIELYDYLIDTIVGWDSAGVEKAFYRIIN